MRRYLQLHEVSSGGCDAVTIANNQPCGVASLSGEGNIKARLVAVLADLEASRELVAAAYVQTALEAIDRAEGPARAST